MQEKLEKFFFLDFIPLKRYILVFLFAPWGYFLKVTTSLTIINDHGGQKLLVKVAPNSEVHQWVRYNGIQTPFEVAFYFELKFIKFDSKLSINRLEVNL